MPTALVPAATKLAAKPDLSPATTLASIQPTRVMRDVGQDMRTIWYFEGAADGRKKTCAYVMHARGSSTFTMAYHPLDRNDQVVADLPMDKLGAAIDDLLAAGFGKRPAPPPSARPGREQGERLSLM